MMKPYCDMTREELEALREKLVREFEEVKGKGLKLDMSRGKPSKDQLDQSNDMMDVVNSASDFNSESAWTAAIMVFWMEFRRRRN